MTKKVYVTTATKNISETVKEMYCTYKALFLSFDHSKGFYNPSQHSPIQTHMLMLGGYATKYQCAHKEFTHKHSHTTCTATRSNLGFSILLWDRRNQIRGKLVDDPLCLFNYSSALRLSQSVCKCSIGHLVLTFLSKILGEGAVHILGDIELPLRTNSFEQFKHAA